MDDCEFMDELIQRIAKRPASDTYVIIRRTCSDLLDYMPPIIMREAPCDKKPFDAIVVELTGEPGHLMLYYRGLEVEFK